MLFTDILRGKHMGNANQRSMLCKSKMLSNGESHGGCGGKDLLMPRRFPQKGWAMRQNSSQMGRRWRA